MTKNSNYQGLISVIISTYNWPDALNLVLHSLNDQTDNHFEVIITDDGSTEDTKQVIDQFKNKSKYSITHLWQEDEGFRAAKARNKGVANAKGDYVVFLDGDCVTKTDFVYNHRRLAEKGYFVTGHRIILSKTFTQDIIKNAIPIWNKSTYYWLLKKIQGKCNKVLPKFVLWSGMSRYKKLNKWQGAKTCNLAFWRDDLIAVNGFDESFEGWGYEDSDLVIRILNYGIKRKSGKFATEVFHLWHKEADRTNEQANLEKLQSLSDHDVRAKYGIGELKQEFT